MSRPILIPGSYQIHSLRRGLQWESPKISPISPQVLLTYAQPQASKARRGGPVCACPVPRCESQAPEFPGHCADSPPFAGPGCARAAWTPAGAPKPSSFSMPAISLSCWARKAAAGSSSAASGTPLSDDEKKPKSSAIFPASLLERPPSARLSPARVRRCAQRPRRGHLSAQGADFGCDRFGVANPHFLSATGPGSPVTAVRTGGAGTGMR